MILFESLWKNRHKIKVDFIFTYLVILNFDKKKVENDYKLWQR